MFDHSRALCIKVFSYYNLKKSLIAENFISLATVSNYSKAQYVYIYICSVMVLLGVTLGSSILVWSSF